MCGFTANHLLGCLLFPSVCVSVCFHALLLERFRDALTDLFLYFLAIFEAWAAWTAWAA